MKEYIIRRYIKGGMQYLILPDDQIAEKEKRDAIELPTISDNLKKQLFELLNNEKISITVYQEKEEIKVSEGYGQYEIADYKVLFGNVSKKLTFPNSIPDPRSKMQYVHYTLTPTDCEGAIVTKTSSRIIGSYVNTTIFIIPPMPAHV